MQRRFVVVDAYISYILIGLCFNDDQSGYLVTGDCGLFGPPTKEAKREADCR